MTDASRYPAQVFWNDDDNGFIAIASDLPGTSAFGETAGEALEELQHAIRAWIEAATAAGNHIPKPTVQRQPGEQAKVLLRLPNSLHAKLVMSADKDGVSLNQYIIYLLSFEEGGRADKSVGNVDPRLLARHFEIALRNTSHPFEFSRSGVVGVAGRWNIYTSNNYPEPVLIQMKPLDPHAPSGIGPFWPAAKERA